MRETNDDILCVVLVDLKELAVVHNAADDLVHVIRLVGVVRDNLVESIVNSADRIICRDYRSLFHVVLRDEAEDVLDDLESFLFCVGSKMRYSALGGVYACSSEVFLANNFTGDGLHHSWTCEEHV